MICCCVSTCIPELPKLPKKEKDPFFLPEAISHIPISLLVGRGRSCDGEFGFDWMRSSTTNPNESRMNLRKRRSTGVIVNFAFVRTGSSAVVVVFMLTPVSNTNRGCAIPMRKSRVTTEFGTEALTTPTPLPPPPAPPPKKIENRSVATVDLRVVS